MPLVKKLSIRLAIFVTTLFLCLFLLEMGMRVAGAIYQGQRQTNFEPKLEDDPGYYNEEVYEHFRQNAPDETRLIVTLGDSFTNGGNVPSTQSYPYKLFQYLNSNTEKKYEVMNLGICGNSTRNVFDQLDHIIENKDKIQKGSTLIFLVGAADIYDLPHARGEDFPFISPSMRSWIYDLRIYKMYRFIYVNVVSENTYVREHTSFQEYDNEKIKEHFNIYFENPSLLENLTDKKIKKNKEIYDRSLKLCEEDVSSKYSYRANLISCVQGISEHMFQYTSLTEGWGESVQLSLDVMDRLPQVFWGFGQRGVYFIPSSFVYALQLQSKVTVDDVLESMKRIKKNRPKVADEMAFRKTEKILKNWRTREKKLDERALKRWDEFMKIARDLNLDIILLNYPIDYKSANERIEKVAKKYSLPLIDINKKFKVYNGSVDIFEDDEHLTPKGYQAMAKDVGNFILGKQKEESPN